MYKHVIAALFIIAELKTAHISNKDRIYKQLWYIHVMEYYSAIKKKEVKECILHDFIYKKLEDKNWRRQWHPTSVLLPGKSHGLRSLIGCSPWGRQESDTTERLHFHFSLSCIGEGNGNPLQCSCLENLRDGGSLVGCRLWGRRVRQD